MAEALGWSLARWRGDHMIMRKAGVGLALSIPDHASVAPGTIRRLIRDMGINVDEFLRMLGR